MCFLRVEVYASEPVDGEVKGDKIEFKKPRGPNLSKTRSTPLVRSNSASWRYLSSREDHET